ncbi:ABC transporter permease [Feifania hominis]|uniref:ABC transporter permease n=1 Tax=Feifania hominis TaxID=2763660 RepID=A0A926DFJ3_9FIRM|nr:ABC transporter permease [Feifania hominis]MBC8536902.1 ABC transporter permease [Feifania hominis]
MNRLWKKIRGANESKLLALLVVTTLFFSILNPDILTLANFYALVRTASVDAIFALAIMVVICSGAFDMSYAMVGAFGSYIMMLLCTLNGWNLPAVFIFLGAIVICVSLEMFNWALIAKLELQPYIATLGTQMILKGAMLAFISTKFIYTLPASISKLSTTYLHTAAYGSGVESQLHITLIFVVALYVIMHVVMTYTNFGRQVYAVGADPAAASRAGIRVARVRLLVFVIAGILCGLGGVLHDVVARCSYPVPSDLVGQELTSIAAVILGTANSAKARGSVLGTLLGVLLLEYISGNMILIGVPSFYIQLASGVLMFVGLVIQMSNRERRRHSLKKEAVPHEA